MGRHLHFDCFSGISGDMVLGALVSAGLPWSQLVNGLKHLKLTGYRLRKRLVQRGALHATKVEVVIQRGFQHPLSLSRIRQILSGSDLPDPVKKQSFAAFDLLAEAEGLAHHVAAHDVHFHEVGVMDSFIDVVGSILGCHLLNVTKVTASAVNMGAGTIQTSHGLLPVPGPAVAALAKGLPIYSDGPRFELATPTGMTLLRTLVSEFGSASPMRPAAIGYGAGDRNPEGWPNALRIFLSEETAPSGFETDRIIQIETNLDDLTPQAYEHVMDRLFAAGALDVTLIPAVMKRSRPGVVLSCLAAREQTNAICAVFFQETTALGIRIQELERRILQRRFDPIKIHGGTVRMKVASLGPGQEKAAPEYADCKTIADRTGLPLKRVMEEATRMYYAGRQNRKR